MAAGLLALSKSPACTLVFPLIVNFCLLHIIRCIFLFLSERRGRRILPAERSALNDKCMICKLINGCHHAYHESVTHHNIPNLNLGITFLRGYDTWSVTHIVLIVSYRYKGILLPNTGTIQNGVHVFVRGSRRAKRASCDDVGILERTRCCTLFPGDRGRACSYLGEGMRCKLLLTSVQHIRIS